MVQIVLLIFFNFFLFKDRKTHTFIWLEGVGIVNVLMMINIFNYTALFIFQGIAGIRIILLYRYKKKSIDSIIKFYKEYGEQATRRDLQNSKTPFDIEKFLMDIRDI